MILAFILAALLCVIAQTDGYTFFIPDELVIMAGGLGAVSIILSGAILDHIIGFFLVSSLLFFAAVIKPGAIGGGDVKLMAATGLYLGTEGIMAAFIIGSIAACLAVAGGFTLGRLNRKSHVAMAPYYVFGIYISMFLLPL
ncbi:A24 family peptidase (plasmid) [Enterocloster clostridioformis]